MEDGRECYFGMFSVGMRVGARARADNSDVIATNESHARRRFNEFGILFFN